MRWLLLLKEHARVNEVELTLIDLVTLSNMVDWLKDNQKNTHLSKVWLKKMFLDMELNCFSKRQKKYDRRILLQQETQIDIIVCLDCYILFWFSFIFLDLIFLFLFFFYFLNDKETHHHDDITYHTTWCYRPRTLKKEQEELMSRFIACSSHS